MKEVIQFAHLPGEDDIDEVGKKYKSCLAAKTSKRAYKKGLSTALYDGFASKTWEYPLRQAQDSADLVLIKAVNMDGKKTSTNVTTNDLGLRVVLQLVYDPKSTIVKKCKTVKQVFKQDSIDFGKEKTTDLVPIVTFGKKQYIWLNKIECENKTEKTMRLISLELLAKAKSFSKSHKNGNNSYALAEELREQCEEEALEFATEEEKAMLVPVKVTSKDNYKKAEPMLENINQFLEGSETQI